MMCGTRTEYGQGEEKTIMKITAVRRSSGFTLVELLVVFVVIGIMLAMLLPAVQLVREAARLSQCSNNLKQVGVAMLNFESARGGYPPALTGANGLSFWGLIPPYIEEDKNTASSANVSAGFQPMGGIAPYNPTVSGNSDATTIAASNANYAHGFFGFTPSWRNCPSRSGNRRAVNSQAWCWNGGTMPAAYTSSRVTTCDYGIINLGSLATTSNSFLSALCSKPNPAGSGGDVGMCGTSTVYTTSRAGCQVLNMALGGDVTTTAVTNSTSNGGVSIPAGALLNTLGFPNSGGASGGWPINNMFRGWLPRTRSRDVVDGTSKTVVIAERNIPVSRLGRFWDGQSNDGPPFYDGSNWCANGQSTMKVRADQIGMARGTDDTSSNWQYKIGSYHNAVVNVLLADGAVRTIAVDISDRTLQRLADRRDGKEEGAPSDSSWLQDQ